MKADITTIRCHAPYLWTLTLAFAALLVPSAAFADARTHASNTPASHVAVATAPVTEAAGVVNLNTASSEEFERLPRIGPAKAQALVALRQRLGGHFQRIEDILRVKGIGRGTFRRLRTMLSLTGPTTLASEPTSRAHSHGDDTEGDDNM